MAASDDEEDEVTITWRPPEKFWGPYETPEDEEWKEEHCLILYMVSLYGKCSLSPNENETWIRDTPLKCLMFEGITAGVIDLDYAPVSVLVSHEGRSRRIWLNVTQEGKAVIDDLREKNMINGLKLTSEDFQPITAYQVSIKGRTFLDKCVTKDIREKVHSFVHAKAPSPPGTLLKAVFDGESFSLQSDDGLYTKESNVTESEDVSYVSSPWLPPSLRADMSKKFTTNKHRAHESAAGGSNIEDELDEAIVLSHVHGLVGEWIPFGSNQIVALNERLGALDRCQGGLFTAMVDKSPTDTQFSVPPGLTQVTILDYDFVKFINFEAEINYPEEEGIVQIENFGMHLNVDGTIVYGVFIDAVLDRQCDDISVDHLSRVLVDVHQDSSQIMNDLLSQYQRSLLDMIFMGDTAMRNKFNCIMAEEVKPAVGKISADDYIDKGDHENELKQVLGDIRAAHDLSKDDVVVVGRDGVLFGGPSIMKHTRLIVAYVSLLCREIFIRSFFVRTFVLDDSLKKIRNLIVEYQRDPNNIERIRDRLNSASRDIILLQEVLAYLKESLDNMVVPPMSTDQVGKRMFKVLDVGQMRTDTSMRCEDLVKLIHGAKNTLSTLQRMTDVINTKQLEDVFKNVESNTKFLVDASAANERSSASLEVMQIILAGGFAFDILDRISGGTLNIIVPAWVEDFFVKPIISVPFLFWFLNMVWLMFVSALLMKLMRSLAAAALGALSLRVKVNQKISMEKLEKFLDARTVDVYDSIVDETFTLKKMTWVEPDANVWKGDTPKIEIFFDHTNEFLLTVFFLIDTKKTPLREFGLMKVFNKLMVEHEVYVDFDHENDRFAKNLSMLGDDKNVK
eukprot:g116.t1